MPELRLESSSLEREGDLCFGASFRGLDSEIAAGEGERGRGLSSAERQRTLAHVEIGPAGEGTAGGSLHQDFTSELPGEAHLFPRDPGLGKRQRKARDLEPARATRG